ncbi:hypothetical protein Aperf_G00000022612 [Anoplocephala perfoliata]
MVLHQQRQAKCRQVRAASLAKQQQRKVTSDTKAADNIREFYRTPTMLAEDEPPFYTEEREDHQQYPEETEEKEYGYEQEHERGDNWRATSSEEPTSTSYDLNSLAEEPGARATQESDVLSGGSEGLDQFNQVPLWMPSEADRRTPTLPWTSSLDADTVIEAKASSSSTPTPVAVGGRRKSTKKTPAPPPPSVIRKPSPSDSDTSSLT